MSSINIKFEVMPFPVPSEVVAIPETRIKGKAHKLNFELSQISPDQLSKMCDDFRASVFEKANQPDPRVPHKRAELDPETYRDF